MYNRDEIIAQVSGHVAEIIAGSFFVLVALGAFSVALLRRDKNTRTLFWLGMWSAGYGLRLLISCPPVTLSFPSWLLAIVPWLDVSISYLILVFALFTWMDFTRLAIRIFLQVMTVLGLLVAMGGVGGFAFSGDVNFFMSYNQLLATVTLIVLITVICIKPLSDRFMALPQRSVLVVATLLFAAEALYTNAARFLGWPTPVISGWLGFAVLLGGLAFSALRIILDSEKRLLTIENELATARNIQFSILPSSFPENHGLDVVAAYHPMTAVAGDFYDYLPVDNKHCGFLICDVSGHGVPAALIASMVKVAIQSAKDVAHDPPKILQHLSRIISPQLQGQFITAAYLFLDQENNMACYSAAGHPPLYYKRHDRRSFTEIESNGLLISAIAEDTYPKREWNIQKGDQFLMYTDGIAEAENKANEQFAEVKFKQLINKNDRQSVRQLSKDLYEALRLWQGNGASQQDDFTWLIIQVN